MATFSKMKDCLWSPLLKTLLFFWSTKAPFCVSIKKKMGRFHLQHGLLRNKGQVPPMNWNTCLTTCFVTQADKVHQSKLHLWQLLQGFAAKNSYKYLLLRTILAIWEYCSSLRVWNPFKPASLLHEALQNCEDHALINITCWSIPIIYGLIINPHYDQLTGLMAQLVEKYNNNLQ